MFILISEFVSAGYTIFTICKHFEDTTFSKMKMISPTATENGLS
jgi:hypothetical protein